MTVGGVYSVRWSPSALHFTDPVAASSAIAEVKVHLFGDLSVRHHIDFTNLQRCAIGTYLSLRPAVGPVTAGFAQDLGRAVELIDPKRVPVAGKNRAYGVRIDQAEKSAGALCYGK